MLTTGKLTVYKASAGSGKTHTLAREYLKQALNDARNPYLFRSILAVTFTNKATEEMKSRIIRTLNDLALGNNGNLSADIQDGLNIDPYELHERAKKVRSAILHNYSLFSVSTIDAFFQKILHAFVREVGLRPGFNLELDTNRLLEEAIENLLKSTSNDKSLRKWLFTLIENRIEERSSWDIRPILMNLGNTVFNEQFRRFDNSFHSKISDKGFMESYAKNLYKVISTFEKMMYELGVSALGIIKEAGLEVSDFKQGARSFANFFIKITKRNFESPNTYVLDAINGIEGWLTKTTKKHSEIESIYLDLSPILKQSVEYMQENALQYFTAREIARKFRELGVLANIDKIIKDIAGEENLMTISDSAHLLGTLINDSDTPFVYERTGNRYKSFMIDEFQDTSDTQWKNFRPLLHDSLAENQFSMVVGDVKQSIYRWRNGDWRILAYRLEKDFSRFGLNEEHLSINWRSKPIIIEFNNSLFQLFSDHMQTRFNKTMVENTNGLSPEEVISLGTIIKKAYTDIVQQPSLKTNAGEGYVCIDVVHGEEEQSATDKVLEKLPLLVADLQDRGYAPSDIAILVRRRKEGQQVANCLLSYKKTSGDTKHCFDVISQDSLFIANSLSVQIIIAAMRMAINPKDPVNTAFLQYQLILHNSDNPSAHTIFIENLPEEEWVFIRHLSNLSLNQAFESLVRHYKLNDNTDELPFLQELHDIVLTFSNRKLSDISSFIEWWDDKGITSTLSPGENQQAINILTIHKSKGLQFPVIIMPLTNWAFEPKLDTTIWVSPQHDPFNALPHVPVAYGKSLQNTEFNPAYLKEKAQSYIDNINLLYVAFTRAESELYIYIPHAKKETKFTLSLVLPIFLKMYTGINNPFEFGKLQGSSQDDGSYIEFGTKQAYQSQKKSYKGFHLDIYPSSIFKGKLRLHYDSDEYFSTEPRTPIQRRNYGILMHRIFAKINILDDCTAAINSLFEEGLIDNKDKVILSLKVEQALQYPVVRQWFDGSWDIKSETGLLIPATGNKTFLTQRPDRVMTRNGETLVIDYKFGLIKEKRYSKQLTNYVNLLNQMGYTNVKAYIWYVDLEKVEEIS
ncbi:MAG: UvrD-helicase domain-containing protein [Prevotellaceae bacterium]|jgi:ATP-dependent exoDNAse (exonuclease V) beta subunit|nr:UvrD-helicase domain-containing protein [Prevotellaceae bacterium]